MYSFTRWKMFVTSCGWESGWADLLSQGRISKLGYAQVNVLAICTLPGRPKCCTQEPYILTGFCGGFTLCYTVVGICWICTQALPWTGCWFAVFLSMNDWSISRIFNRRLSSSLDRSVLLDIWFRFAGHFVIFVWPFYCINKWVGFRADSDRQALLQPRVIWRSPSPTYQSLSTTLPPSFLPSTCPRPQV